MEELKINLDEYQKLSKNGRTFNIIIGYALVFISATIIILRIIEGQSFGNYFFFVVLLFLGLYILLYTFGIFYRIRHRYVIINEEGMEYKLSYFYPPRVISWHELKRVDIKTLRIFFHLTSGSSCKMKLGEIFYNDIRNIKQVLAKNCTKKGIEWTDTSIKKQFGDSKA